MPVFVLYHSIVLIFNNFNGSIWFNNSKHFRFLFPEMLPSLAFLHFFFLKFFIDTPVETYSYSLGRENNFQLCFNSTRLHFLPKCWNCSSKKKNSFCCECWSTLHVKNFTHLIRVFSLTWPASTQIYWNKRKRLHKKTVQLPQDWFRTRTWPPFHCFNLGHKYGRRDVMWKHSRKCFKKLRICKISTWPKDFS